jgi:hypothetical protein
MLVAALEQQPLGFPARSRALQHEAPAQLVAVEHEHGVPARKSLRPWHAASLLVGPAIPHDDGAVAAHPLKEIVSARVVGDLDRQALDGGVERRALGNGPGAHHAIHLQPQVEVVRAGEVLLHDEDPRADAAHGELLVALRRDRLDLEIPHVRERGAATQEFRELVHGRRGALAMHANGAVGLVSHPTGQPELARPRDRRLAKPHALDISTRQRTDRSGAGAIAAIGHDRRLTWDRLGRRGVALPEMLRARFAAPALLATCLAGCGEATPPSRPPALGALRRGVTQTPTTRQGAAQPPATQTADSGSGASTAAASSRSSVAARVDAKSDAVLAEGKVHIAQGAPSDAEVRREVKALRKAGVVLPSGDNAASFANSPTYSGAGAEVQTPETPWNPRFKPIAAWIVPVLEWASTHGWGGTVTSGYRTYFEQAQLNAAGLFSAPAGASNHEKTAYPGGAVDVTDPSELITVLKSYPGQEKLVGGVLGSVDPEHFSATGY